MASSFFNLPQNPASTVFDYVFGFGFVLPRDHPTKFAVTTDGRWDAVRQPVAALRMTTLGVLGVGTIGYPVAWIANDAFGARIVAHDPYIDY